MKRLTLYFYRDKAGKFRWRLRARNGRNLCTPGESFNRRGDCAANAALCLHALCWRNPRYSKDWFAKGRW